MIQYYGRAPKGERCFDAAPCGHWNTTTMLSSIHFDGNTESIVFRGALNKDLFESYVEHVLAPSLRPGDIVIMDNLRAHKSPRVVDLIHARQAEVRFLPPYSPHLNPIEKMGTLQNSWQLGLQSCNILISQDISYASKGNLEFFKAPCG